MGRPCCDRPAHAPGAWPGLRALALGPAPAPLRITPRDAYLFAHRRRKLWELSESLHCSVIGTCLSTAELRKLLLKLNPARAGFSDHDLHSTGVGLAGAHTTSAKLIHKALDQRHGPALRRFDRAGTESAVRALWEEAVAQGDIPGPYWAVLTHPDSSQELLRDGFAHVHMLSHLVGAANRADIRRLASLEAENAALAAKVARQQARLQEAVTGRDATIRDLRQHLLHRAGEAASGAAPPSDAAICAMLAETQRRLDGEVGHRAALERRLEETRASLDAERRAGAAARAREAALRDEIEAIEAGLVPDGTGEARGRLHLRGMTLLYVGGRPNQSAPLRHIAEAAGASLLLHDGGVEDAEAQLAGLVSRADVSLFPVDCVSHDAALAVKRLCRRLDKPFIPLRGTGGTAFLAALHRLAARVEHSA